MPNPYQPPETAPANLTHDCPVCEQPVGFYRFAFPFGYCKHCRNYLTIRDWGGESWFWTASIIGIIAIPIALRSYKIIDFTPPIGTMILIWFAASIIHGKVHGRLVPAYCWGFFAARDDDRLSQDDS